MQNEPELIVTRRKLPHWTLEGSVYFVTFRLAHGSLDAAERGIVLGHIRAGDPGFYRLVAAVVMPDHVHVILQPNAGITLSRVMRGIKGSTARLLNERRGRLGQVWQAESWDRILRGPRELEEKLQYMLHNPLKAGLAEDPWQYDGWYMNPASDD